MVEGVLFWVFFGSLYLIWLTIQDYRSKGWVDDRKNYFMMGVSVSLLMVLSREWWYLLSLTAIVILLNIFLNKRKAIGEADISSITWLVLGFGIISPFKLLGFFFVFAFIFSVAFVLKRWVFRYKQPQPAYGLITLVWFLSLWLTGLIG